MKKQVPIIIFLLLMLGCSRNDRSDAYGNFEAVEVVLSAEYNGRILFLNIEDGSLIQLNDTLGLIDTTDLSLKREQLEKQVVVVQTRLRNVDSQINVLQQQRKNILVEKNRLEKLFKDGAATQKQMDDVSGSLDLIDQQIIATGVQKESILAEKATLAVQISQVEETISRCWLIAPANGTVLTKYAEPGEVTSYGRPVCKIADLSVMDLKVYISGDQLPQIRIGQEVEVLIDKDKEDYYHLTGVVSWISAKAEFSPKTIQTKKERVNLVYAAKVKVQNDGSLKIGMPGEVNFAPK